MRSYLIVLATSSQVFAFGLSTAVAQEEGQIEAATPIEIYACNYNEGMSAADLDAVTAKWNRWADKQKLNDYSAWTLVPFYSGPEQEFDYLWLGGSPTAKALGRAQDDWLATGGKVQEEFENVGPCNAHGNFAALQLKEPPERRNPSNIVISFSDCNFNEGTSFGDVAPALSAWAEYRTAHGSTAGMWALFPAYGGGGEEFDFKFVASYANYEEQGVDWDQYSQGGYQKAEEIFADMLDCDSSRVYSATNRRMAADDDE